MGEAAGTTPVRRELGGRRLAHVVWHPQTLRAQLLILFILIEFVAAAVAGGVTVLKARTATRVEIAASMELAELWVNETVALAQRAAPAEQFLTDLSSQLKHVRHVRIVIKDAAGHVIEVRPAASPVAADTDDEAVVGWLSGFLSAPAPAWFAALIEPPIERRVVPVAVAGKAVGSVEVVSEPKDEIGEKWETTALLAVVGLAITFAVIAILYGLVGRVLRPLTALADGLGELEQRHYQVRLSRPRPPELAAMTDRFNALAGALETTRAENQSLNGRLITAQDDERRRTALDLHDEVGPSLFGLKAHAASIAKAADGLPGEKAQAVKARVSDLLAIIDHLQAINRSMLNRLRPMALGQLPLQDVLAELVHERARQYPQIRFTFSARVLERSYGEPIDLTLYRCVQEGLTNAIRHAQASRVEIEVEEGMQRNGVERAVIRLTVRDDGRGIDPLAPKGLGSLGMQERVEGLGGEYEVESRNGNGTCLHVAIPLRAQNGAGNGVASKVWHEQRSHH
jgi:two-component system sensor histidine kinase UhpB